MREMLKRRQFIFGKQNTNRHQPQVDDVVTSVYTQYNNASNVPDEGDVDAVMKFCPSKADVMYILDHAADDYDGDPAQKPSVNVSEKDLEFFGTFLYSVSGQQKTRGAHNYNRDICHIGYAYKLTGGTSTYWDEGERMEESLKGMCILLPGPALVNENKTVFPNIRRPLDDSDYNRIREELGVNTLTDEALVGITHSSRDISTSGINSDFEGAEITEFDNIGDTITLEPSIMKYLEDKICFSEHGFPYNEQPSI